MGVELVQGMLPWFKRFCVSLILALEVLGPVGVAFFGSVVLSVVAISGAIVPNNDGMLYIEAAKLYREGGLESARQLFNWMVLPRSLIGILIAFVSTATGMSLEGSGYLIATLLLSGVCALLVACTRDRVPEAGWAACAVVLSLPALNVYRDYILREFGAWFFLMLALWLVLRWERGGSWVSAFIAQICICVAALFRPECLSVLLALVLWQLFSVRRSAGVGNLFVMSIVPLCGAAIFAVLLVAGGGEIAAKAMQIVDLLSPSEKFRSFVAHSERLASYVLNRWSRENANLILIVGLLSLVPAKLLSNCGILTIPLVFVFARERLRFLLTLWGPFFWAGLVFLVVLAGFVIERAYLAARYVAPLALVLVPFIALGVARVYSRYIKWRPALCATLVFVSIANVVSTTPAKSRLSEAADWLTRQAYKEEKVYVEMPEIAYLVGWSFTKARRGLPDRDAVQLALVSRQIDLALLDEPASSNELNEWSQKNGFVILREFADRRKRKVYAIARPDDR